MKSIPVCVRVSLFVMAVVCGPGIVAADPAVPKETAAEAVRRHERVAERRKGMDILR